ncbi:MAG: hypothetical protein ACR2GH_21245 [Pseudonocardia sp.]
MLLLVLILVLIAFSLLVVALLSSSVLWAWVSVGVSVAAAAVLLVDWLQRRSAVKAGAATAVPGGGGSPPSRAPMTLRADVEPVTQVLPVQPVVPPPSRPVAAGTGAVNGGSQKGPNARFDQVWGTQQTMVMPPLQPSSSPDRPSSAPPGITLSGGSSPDVVKSGPDPTSDTSVSGDVGETATDAPDGSGAQPASGEPAAAPSDVGASDTGSASEPPAGSTDSGESPLGEAAAPPEAAVPPEVAAEDGPPRESAATAPLGPDGELLEEQRDAAVAVLVAGIDDEVVVIDEQPRYHVIGCQWLVAKELIPLPAREAVELGFTPCGWCSPDRTLANRHPAAAR